MMSKIAFLLVLALSIVSCVSQENTVAIELWENPVPKPEFLNSIYFGKEAMCLDIFLGYFTNESLAPPNIGLDELIGKVEYSVNGRQAIILEQSNDRHYFTSCFRIDMLSTGFHHATINLMDFSNNEVSYSWAFQVTDSISGLAFEELEARVLLPDLN